LLSLLRIIEPQAGKIYIDDVDVTELGLDDLRQKITIIPQVIKFTKSSKSFKKGSAII